MIDDRRIVRGDTRRAAILAAATREFGRKGYETHASPTSPARRV
ncbi:hypothetical protein [Nocardiopsis sp. FIRDI 009]|nr:hypothetical protein [Nocardiopsis sp. FIRDI 009]